MRQNGTRELYTYWDRQRGDAAAPTRADITPHAMAKILPYLFILNADGNTPVFRLAGTWVCGAFGTEWTGRPLTAMFGIRDAGLANRLASSVLSETMAAVIDVTAAPGAGHKGDELDLEMILLPLADQPARILGAIHPAERPVWLGAQPLKPARIAGLRMIDPDARDGWEANRPPVILPRTEHSIDQEADGLRVIEGNLRRASDRRRPQGAPNLRVVEGGLTREGQPSA